MYIILNKTKNETKIHEGSWPSFYLDELLDNDNDIIVISTYSNSIKVVDNVKEDFFGKVYTWKEYDFTLGLELITTLAKQEHNQEFQQQIKSLLK